MKDTTTRFLLGAVLVGILIVGYAYLRAPEATLVKVGEMAPALELPSIGETVPTKLSSFRGRPVLLVMFLSGCRICESQAPALERVYREYYRRGLVVLGVSVDAERTTTKAFIERHSITFFVLEDPNGRAVREAYGSWRMPEAYLIDASGKLDAIYLGATNLRAPELRERLERLLPWPKPGEGR